MSEPGIEHYTVETGRHKWAVEAGSYLDAATLAFRLAPPTEPGELTKVKMLGYPAHYILTEIVLDALGAGPEEAALSAGHE